MLLDWERSEALKRNPNLDCPNETLTAEEAYFDFNSIQPYGVMQCFCENLRKEKGLRFANNYSFSEFSDHGHD